MKKAIFSALTTLLLVCVAFGQKTNPEIYNIIKLSKEYNAQYNGVADPNKIWPGQVLTFLFKDGTQHSIVVEPGDNQWTIVRDKLSKLENEHGPIVNPDTATIQPQELPKEPESIFSSPTIPWWGWIIFVLLIVIVLSGLSHLLESTKKVDPVTAGSPQVPGGVNDAGAHSRMQEVAGNRFPGARIQIKNIRRGWLSGLAKVFYADGKSKKLKLKDVAAYAGEALINGREQTIYFLQGCGNDARQGNYMTGNLDFRPDVVINQDGSESPLPVAETPTVDTPAVEEPKQIVNLGSETHQQRMKALNIIEAEMVKGDVHEVTLDINPENFGAHIKYKFVAKKVTAEKKEKK